MTVTTTHFELLQKLVKDNAGIVLAEGKEYLVESRMTALARKLDYESPEEMLDKLQKSPRGELLAEVIDAMTTNETSFFREMHVFEGFRDIVLPDIIEKNQSTKTLRMWCGASSSGQEPYSVAIAMAEWFPQLNDWTTNFVATDISGEMLERCRTGVYSQLEVNRGLPAVMLVKHFDRNGTEWTVKDALRRKVQFLPQNLLEGWSAVPPRLDIVFMRNVLIYFDVETKQQILGKVQKALKPGGYLFLGSAESTLNLDSSFERVKFARGCCYKLKD